MFAASSGGGAFVALIFFVIWLALLAVGILNIIGLWKAFVKMGDPGWYAIVPLLNLYRIFQRSRGDQAIMFTILGALCGIGGILAAIDLASLFNTSIIKGFLPFLMKDEVYQGPPPPPLG